MMKGISARNCLTTLQLGTCFLTKKKLTIEFQCAASDRALSRADCGENTNPKFELHGISPITLAMHSFSISGDHDLVRDYRDI